MENPDEHNAYMERLIKEVIQKDGLDFLKAIFALTRLLDNFSRIPNIALLHQLFNEMNEGLDLTGNKRLRFLMYVNEVTDVSSVAQSHRDNDQLHSAQPQKRNVEPN